MEFNGYLKKLNINKVEHTEAFLKELQHNHVTTIPYENLDLVKKDLMLENDFTPDCPREFLNYVSLQEISPTGVWGKSSLGTKEKGELILKYRTEAALEHIELATKLGKKKAW